MRKQSTIFPLSMLILISILSSLITILIINSDPPILDEIETNLKLHFEGLNESNLTCYDMSEISKEYIEDNYDYPVVYVHGECTRNLKSLYHTWLMIKIDGNWHEFEATALRFIDVSNSFELKYMTYDYKLEE